MSGPSASPEKEARLSEVNRTFWGKASSLPGDARWHPIVFHLLDVAASTRALLMARPVTRARLAALLHLEEQRAIDLITALAGLHDIGKFAPAFQFKRRDLCHSSLAGVAERPNRHHTTDGMMLWNESLAELAVPFLWRGGQRPLDALSRGIFGHHGRPLRDDPNEYEAKSLFGGCSYDAAMHCSRDVLSILHPTPLEVPPPSMADAVIATWYAAGIVTVADWIGSNDERWFPYAGERERELTLADYWALAKSRAHVAIEESGLTSTKSAARQSAAEHIAREWTTPAQRWADTVSIPDAPTLFIIEDVTGSGKTEAAQILVHRLMAQGRVAGAYWAMPTQATANAMYERQATALRRLFDMKGSGPSLVLAHGQRNLHDGFRDSVFQSVLHRASEAVSDDTDELRSEVACAAWLADDSRRALLADIGAGTIDQAFLAILPSRHNVVRLFGLADKVLVVDEAHAYDTYMSEELGALLRFQGALGGYAIVLSATLPLEERASIARAWQGALKNAWVSPQMQLESSAYPLATVIDAAGILTEAPFEAASWSHREVSVRLVHDFDSALEHVVQMAERDAAVAWVRNTVDDCLDAARMLRGRGLDPIIFHARFAQGDRQRIERSVMTEFGEVSVPETRRGRIVVATQVVEQSLDLDFDAMVSDVAPIDLLIQRAGRLWRHTRSRPEGVQRELVVLSPPVTEVPKEGWAKGAFAGTSAVYVNVPLLWRTVRQLAKVGSISTPHGVRDLIESVYAVDEVPEGLLRYSDLAEGKERAARTVARFGTLQPREGYDGNAKAWQHEVHAVTRLGAHRVVLRLARVRSDGALEPWESGEHNPRKAWSLSEVHVSVRRVPPGTQATGDSAAVADARTQWSRYEQDLIVLPLRERTEGLWTGSLRKTNGTVLELSYTQTQGLAYGPRVP